MVKALAWRSVKSTAAWLARPSYARRKDSSFIMNMQRSNDSSHYSEGVANCAKFFVALQMILLNLRLKVLNLLACKLSLRRQASTGFCGKRKISVVHDLILCTLKFANVCHDICCKTVGSCEIGRAHV